MSDADASVSDSTDPLVADLVDWIIGGGFCMAPDDIERTRGRCARLSAVLAAARSVLVAGPHSDLAVEIEAIRTSLAAADGAR